MNKQGSCLLSIAVLPLLTGGVSEYIDPGTGSLIIQIVIAGFVGGVFLLKVYWRRVKAWFSRGKKDDE